MSGRYVSPAAASILAEFGLRQSSWQFTANFNTAPLCVVPAIRSDGLNNTGILMRWGLGRHARHHAPVESLATGVDFHASWKQGRRCIIPALGFYEWHKNPDGTTQPYYIHVDDQDVFGFAGLWMAQGADANAVTDSCAVVTMPATAFMRQIHGTTRMPAILKRAQRDAWLCGDHQAAGEALAPYAPERMIAYAVSSRIDVAGNNDETLLEPLETDVD
jgi:putative SOS response-associated peptidase YedK